MKHLFLTVILIIISVFSLSFLVDVNKNEHNTIFIYIDKKIEHGKLVKDDLYNTLMLEENYKNIIFSDFNIKNIDSYIVSNGKNSLFITTNPIKSKLFTLKSVRYKKTIVAVTSYRNPINSIDYSKLITLYKVSENKMNKNLKKLIYDNKSISVLPYNRLTIELKPLEVDGIFPSIYNIKKDLYPATFKIFISTINHRLYRQCKKIEDNEIKDDMFSIIAGGDIMLGRAVKRYIKKYGIYYPFEKIKGIISSNDIAFANLESPLTKSQVKFYPDKGIYFKADPIMALSLKWCGFDILSLANNHIYDWSFDGVRDTEKYLKRVGIKYSGVGKTIKDALRPAVFNIGRTKVCFVSMNDIYPTEEKNGKNIIKSYTYNKNIKNDIGHLKKRYDIVVISYHTGIEYNEHPEPDKIQKMKNLIDYGADIIFGSHPHVVQDIEIYRNRLIAYSLGNLIFDQNWSEDTSKGLLLEVGFFKKRLIYFRPIDIDIIKGQANLINSPGGENLRIVLNY